MATTNTDEIDPEALAEFREWLNEPIACDFPDGYRLGEF